MKVHIPIGDVLLCGSASWAAQIMSDRQLCTRCVKRLDNLLASMTDAQLAKFGLKRAESCANHWHCDPKVAAHACDAPDRSQPCPGCGQEAR